MINGQYAEIEMVKMRARGGATITLAIASALMTACELGCPVTVRHNDEIYIIKPNEIIDPIIENHRKAPDA